VLAGVCGAAALQHMVFLLPFKDSILDWLLASLYDNILGQAS
jgi:hypothetical protein